MCVPVPSPQYVRDLSLTGEFNALTDGQINNVITDEVVYHYKAMTTEDMYARVVGLHTAHLLWQRLQSVVSGGGGGGPVVLLRAKVGPLEKQYGQAVKPFDLSNGDFAMSPYGRALEALLDTRLSMQISSP